MKVADFPKSLLPPCQLHSLTSQKITNLNFYNRVLVQISIKILHDVSAAAFGLLKLAERLSSYWFISYAPLRRILYKTVFIILYSTYLQQVQCIYEELSSACSLWTFPLIHNTSYFHFIVIYPACVSAPTVIVVSINIYAFRQTNPKSLNLLIDCYCLYDLRWLMFDALCTAMIDIYNAIFLIRSTNCDI